MTDERVVGVLDKSISIALKQAGQIDTVIAVLQAMDAQLGILHQRINTLEAKVNFLEGGPIP